MANISNEKKSIILIGFMGVGKTTVGKLLANRLNRDFIDIDNEIEKEFQMSIKDIFQSYGEKAFRQIEKETVIDYAKQRCKVISLGGGAFMQKEIRDACLENGTVFHLDISWGCWMERMSMLVDDRPLLQEKSMREIETLFYERKDVYSTNHFALMTDNYTKEDVADNIINMLKL